MAVSSATRCIMVRIAGEEVLVFHADDPANAVDLKKIRLTQQDLLDGAVVFLPNAEETQVVLFAAQGGRFHVDNQLTGAKKALEAGVTFEVRDGVWTFRG